MQGCLEKEKISKQKVNEKGFPSRKIVFENHLSSKENKGNCEKTIDSSEKEREMRTKNLRLSKWNEHK